MKTLRESLLDDDLSDSFDKNIKAEIKKFLKLNYKGYSNCKISREPNQYGKYEVSSAKGIEVKNKNITSLTNGTFVWSEVTGNFNCLDCYSLKSLEGAPEKVGGKFDCSSCDSLTSLKGAPKETTNKFICSSCASLTSLKGISKTAKVIDASNNVNLKSLDGLPEEADYVWVPKHFTEDDVRKICSIYDSGITFWKNPSEVGNYSLDNSLA